MTPSRSWQEIAAEAKEHQSATVADALIQPPVPDILDDLPRDVTGLPRKLLSANEVELTEIPAEELVSRLASGSVSAVSVTQAFLRRAGLAQRLSNCVVELLAGSALARAAELDAHLKQHGKPIGPLHGLPISVKEHVSQKGLGLCAGYVAHWGTPDWVAKEDVLVVAQLRAAGAVIHARTTEPQTIMHLETSSNLWGVTVNPHNRDLSPGGSSGGEGALIALRGSCLGVGTDIGGSIRSPAGNCGIFGLRPTSHRIPYHGVEPTNVLSSGVLGVQGPMSTSIEGMRMYMRAMLDYKPWLKEPDIVPLPWTDPPALKKGDRLKIGIMWHDGVVQPHPPIRRGLKEVAQGLKTLPGIELVDFGPSSHPSHETSWDVIASLYFADGGDGEIALLEASGEPMRPLTNWLLKEDGHVKRQDMEGLWNWQIQREEFEKAYNQAWLNTGDGKGADAMDVLLCPYFPSASSIFDTAKYWAYTSTWNLVDYPALVFPVSKVDPEVDKIDTDFKPVSDKDEWNHKLYDPEKFSGAPISLQLVGRRFEEEKLLAVAEYITKELKLPLAPL